MFSMPKLFPQIKRLYIYQFHGAWTDEAFDAGLVDKHADQEAQGLHRGAEAPVGQAVSSRLHRRCPLCRHNRLAENRLDLAPRRRGSTSATDAKPVAPASAGRLLSARTGKPRRIGDTSVSVRKLESGDDGYDNDLFPDCVHRRTPAGSRWPLLLPKLASLSCQPGRRRSEAASPQSWPRSGEGRSRSWFRLRSLG